MKTYQECIDWMEEVEKYRKSAPEGMYAASKDIFPTLRDVDPEVITQLSKDFPVVTTLHPFNGQKTSKLSGSPDGAWYEATIIFTPKIQKMSQMGFRFFYRKPKNNGPDTV